MSYGSDSSLGVESEDDKEGHLSPGRYISSVRWDRREQNNKPNWKKGLKGGGSGLGICVRGLGGSHTQDLRSLEIWKLTQIELFFFARKEPWE